MRGVVGESINFQKKKSEEKKSGERRQRTEHLPSWRGGGDAAAGRKSPPERGQPRNPSGAAGLSLGGRSRAELRAPPGRVRQAQEIGGEAVTGARVRGPEPEQRRDAPGNRRGAEARPPAAGAKPSRRATREPRVRRGRAGDCSSARRSLSNVHQRRR